MAEKRMLTRKITDDDNFTSLSSSAQALYLHLNVNADDDGFCNQVSTAMFRSHASVQDLQALLEKRYIIQFDNGVIVIKHWRMANALRKDRYTPTTFQEEFKKLHIKENGAYTLSDDDGCQLVATGLPQNRLDKNSIDKNNNICASDNDYSNGFEVFWANYPRKIDKAKANKCYQARLKEGWSEEELLTAAKNYADYCKKNNTEPKYIKHGATFLSAGTPFTDYLKGEANESGTTRNEGDAYTESRNRLLERYGIMS